MAEEPMVCAACNRPIQPWADVAWVKPRIPATFGTPERTPEPEPRLYHKGCVPFGAKILWEGKLRDWPGADAGY